jgi:hypothetical protein
MPGEISLSGKPSRHGRKDVSQIGLYNEKLDQIPTFIGIEAPEMLDADYLFLPRTTMEMMHGQFQNSKRVFS